ncbi:MAG: hypothetical protein LBC69_04440, partial [Eubacteriaceae bacterium]|nr:hypothetical protein [Eubacteriaceae bacterium]
MNYKEYLSIKRSCKRKIKIFSVSVYLIALLAVVQTLISFLRINVFIDPIYTYLLELLFSAAQKSAGNTVLAYLFYAIYAAIVLSLLLCSALTFGTRRLPYGFVIGLYVVDAVLCLLAASYYRFLVHLTL